MPETSPELDIVAMPVADELHTQPPLGELTVDAPPIHIFVRPEIGAGVSPTVYVVVV